MIGADGVHSLNIFDGRSLHNDQQAEYAMLDNIFPMFARQYGGKREQANAPHLGDMLDCANVTLAHRDCNDRNQTGMGLGHFLGHERPYKPKIAISF